MNKVIKINSNGIKRTIGKNNPVFITAEIGINHNGDLALAKECISAAVSCGADGVKLQNYDVNDFIIDNKLTYSYKSLGKNVVESQREMFKRYQLSYKQLSELKEYAIKEKIILFSTPSGSKGLRDIERLNLPIIKNASDSIVNLNLIEEMGKTGKVCILSTGMANLSEIDDALRKFEKTGNKNLIILVCTSNYPTKPKDVNIKRIKSLETAFGTLVGFSDHTEGNYAAVAAVTLGAVFIEKHFTIDKSLPGPDHWFSSDINEFDLYVKAIRNSEMALGNGIIKLSKSEAKSANDFKLTLTFNKDLQKAHRINNSDIISARPGKGLPPRFLKYFLGKELNRNVKKGEKLNFEIITKS